MTDARFPTPPPEFHAHVESMSIEFDSGDIERLGSYLALLLEGNQTCNLTAIVEPREMWIRHAFDSLTLLPLLADLAPGARVIDVGSGGGAPGVPLAMTRPDLSFTFIEATGKKARFLEETIRRLELGNVSVIAERAEDVGRDRQRHRDAHDFATCRAVGRLAVAAELSLPLVKVGGVAALIKGAKAEEELEEGRQALHLLHASCAGVIPTPTGRIVALEKLRATPRDYPRRPGEPKRIPLGVAMGKRTK